MKNVIITGTSSGIGLELVKIFSKEDFKVISLSRSDLSFKPLNRVRHINFDITDEKSVDNLTHINNAGKLVNKPFEDISRDDLYSVFDVNVFGVFNLIQKLLPFFKKKSHVVNISSVGGLVGSSKFPGLTAYSSSKGALNILTEVLAEEYAESGPKFNSLSLGSVNTPMLKEAFPGYSAKVNPDEMASFIFNFANTASSIFNGKVIPVSSTNP